MFNIRQTLSIDPMYKLDSINGNVRGGTMRNGASSLDDIAINAEPGCPPSSPLSYKAERDTRGRLRAEKDLRQLIEDLETRLEETKSDLLTANADLSRTLEEGRRLQEQLRHAQKMASIGTLASGLAHEFSNLLNIIQGYVSLIMHHPDDPQQVIADIQVIRETVAEGATLAQLLLTVAQKPEVKFGLADINTLVQRLAKLLTGSFSAKLVISLQLDLEAPNVKIDAKQINQALLNLCINARDAMPDGGNLLLRSRTISRAELGGRFHEPKAERYAWISVTDTGLGMTEEIKSRLFEPFFTTKQPGKGTGLGLSVVYGIVRDHNGFVDVTSEPGRGSTFHIYLPMLENQSIVVGTPVSSEENVARAHIGNLCVEGEAKELGL
jgi:signal transduction histidine kinase